MQSNGETPFTRRETDLEREQRMRDQLPYQMAVDRFVKVVTSYDFARRRGLVTYSRVGLRSRRD